ncbi:hypothetical protein I302_100944 [Kwoniella bestiolae CBS 10118]|uniref:Uncharacterized protein n=1 Tax=Kwoniella bestiolae CBS 10118 TaxID=1296100 RepID=A0A1B9G6H6_9TREE|nr:hypothetical protein I302_04321 [Kwoniella bestiolae CBS 10118]OCF26635.1 hypothetical protein I302_04321 [Kwoniella bestiolae CBS 10118]
MTSNVPASTSSGTTIETTAPTAASNIIENATDATSDTTLGQSSFKIDPNITYLRPYHREGPTLIRAFDRPTWWKLKLNRGIASAAAESLVDHPKHRMFLALSKLRSERLCELDLTQFELSGGVAAALSTVMKNDCEPWEDAVRKDVEGVMQKYPPKRGSPPMEVVDHPKMMAINNDRVTSGQGSVFEPFDQAKYHSQNQKRWEGTELLDIRSAYGHTWFIIEGEPNEDNEDEEVIDD